MAEVIKPLVAADVAVDAVTGRLIVETPELAGTGLTFARKQLAADAGTVVIVAAAVGVTARVMGLNLVVAGAQATLTLKDSDGATLTVLGTFPVGGGIVLDNVAMAKLSHAQAPAGKGLSITASAGTMTGQVLYATE